MAKGGGDERGEGTEKERKGERHGKRAEGGVFGRLAHSTRPPVHFLPFSLAPCPSWSHDSGLHQKSVRGSHTERRCRRFAERDLDGRGIGRGREGQGREEEEEMGMRDFQLYRGREGPQEKSAFEPQREGNGPN